MENLLGKKVVVFGLGKSGVSAAKLLVKKSVIPYLINKNDPDSWGDLEGLRELIPSEHMVNQENSKHLFDQADLIILSPGIPREHYLLKDAIAKQIPVISDVELASWYCDATYIAITGSNGKTTTTSMIYEMLKLAGKDVFVGGNIGIPFCECILQDRKPEYVVLELSSFQLESMPTFHPHIAIILNIFQNHGERYSSIEDYVGAKFNITKNMTDKDYLIYSSDFQLIDRFCSTQKCKLFPVASLNSIIINSELETQYSLADMKVHGQHNRSNLYFAHQVAKILSLPKTSVQKMIDTFCGVEHRMQFIPSDDKFISYNDAKSTNWDALTTAVVSIDKHNKDLWVIVGGQPRSKDDSISLHINLLKKHADKILLIGDTTDQFAKELENYIPIEKCYDLATAIAYTRNSDFSGILLLSPAFPSYDQYQNFNKRGEHFIKLITGQ